MYLVFCVFFSFIDLFHFFALASVVVNQKASTEADVMSKIEIDRVLKYAPDEIDARDRGKIYIFSATLTSSISLILKDIFKYSTHFINVA